MKVVIRAGLESELYVVSKLADKYDKWVGWVHHGSLRDSIETDSFYVAEVDSKIVGFISWSIRKRDPGQTLNYIVVDEEYRDLDIATQLFKLVPVPIRLSCTIDNDIGNAFYKKMGMEISRIKKGKHRDLNVWEKK